VSVDGQIDLTGMSLTANTWYYIYLYEEAGEGAIEYSTQEPDAPYLGTARVKGGPDNTDPTVAPDPTRRYLAPIKSGASANTLRDFIHLPSDEAIYFRETAVAFNLGGAATSFGTRDISAWCPPVTDRAYLHFYTNGSSGVDINLDPTNVANQPLTVARVTSTSQMWAPVYDGQVVARNVSGSGSTDIHVLAYLLGR
jgi:hypothetical protein